jgi:O-antigen/teichoic acid export membrane protein
LPELSVEGPGELALAPLGSPPPSRPSTAVAHRRWLLDWAGRVAEFGFVQCVVQLLAGVAGILVVRTMAKEQYALYAITNQMQTACNLLADLGIGIGVRSIGGRVWQNPQRFGELVVTALGMRRWFAAFSLAACLPVAAWMLVSNGAAWSAAAVLCGVLVASVLPMLAASVHLVVPQLHGEYRRIQKLDLGNAALRLALIASLAATRITAALAAAVGAVSGWIQLAWLRRWSQEHADATAPANADDRRDLVRLSLQSFPNTLFFCFQGQVTLLILTLVGSASEIADISALGRLGVLLAVFSTTFGNVLAPGFVRCQDASRLPRLYLGLVGAVIVPLIVATLVAWFTPGPLLWLLGEQYAGLSRECGVVVLASCLTALNGVFWTLNSGRQWITFSSTLFIPLTLAAQAAFAASYDLGSLAAVAWFQVGTNLVATALLTADGWLGLSRAKSDLAPRYDESR